MTDATNARHLITQMEATEKAARDTLFAKALQQSFAVSARRARRVKKLER